MKKNIAFLVFSTDIPGGVERVVSTVTNALVSYDNKAEIFILSFYGEGKPFFDLDSRIKICYLYDKKYKMSDKLLGTIGGIRNFLIVNKITDIVVVDIGLTIHSLLASLGLGLNRIFWTHAKYIPYDESIIPNRVKFARFLVKRFFSYIITLTERDRVEWAKKGNKANTVVILNPLSYDISSLTPKYDSKIVLSIGRLSYEKGFDLLIQAWAKIKNKNGWQLNIVGDGPEKENLLKLIDDNDLNQSIKIYPFSNNISEFYSKSSIYCLPSRSEGLPLVLIEAISFGLPVVSFDCYTGPSEIIQTCGKLCRPEDVDDLSKKLISFMSMGNKEYSKLSLNAKEDAKRFNLVNIINQWKNILGI